MEIDITSYEVRLCCVTFYHSPEYSRKYPQLKMADFGLSQKYNTNFQQTQKLRSPKKTTKSQTKKIQRSIPA